MRKVTATRILGTVLLLCALGGAVWGFLGFAAMAHNAFSTCETSTTPEDALSWGAGYAGQAVAVLPLVSVECSWNMQDGAVTMTRLIDWRTTIEVWSAILLGVGGIGVLGWAATQAEREERLKLPDLDSNQEPID